MALGQGGHSLGVPVFSEMRALQHSSSHKDFKTRMASIWILASSPIALVQLSSASSLSFLMFEVDILLLFKVDILLRHLFCHLLAAIGHDQ